MRHLFPLLTLCTCVAVTAHAQETETFPSDYLPEDFLLPLIQGKEGTTPAAQQALPEASGRQPVTFSIQQLPHTPSLTVPGGASVPTQALPHTLTSDTFVLPNAPAAEAPLPEDLWRGTTAEAAKTVLQRLTAQGLKNQTAYDLLHRILLADAAVPAGTSDVAWLATRAQLLLEMHLAEDAYRLMQPVVPEQLTQHPDLAEIWTVTTLLSGKHERACGYVKQQVLNTDAPFWRQALLVCQTVQGEAKALELSLNLVDDAVTKADPTLVPLLQSLLSQKEEETPPPAGPLTPLKAVVYAAFPQMIQPEMLPDLPDMMLRRVLQTEQLGKNLRLKAGELLVNQQHRAQDVLALTKLYDSFEFDVSTVRDPLQAAAAEEEGAVARALLWQAAALGQLTSTRAQALQALWHRAQADGLSNLPGALLPRSRNIQPHPNLAWFAPDVVEVALQAGETAVAKAWWEVLQANKTLSQELVSKRTELLIATAFMQGKVAPELLEKWWQGQQLSTPEEQTRLQRILAVLDAVNVPIPLAYWQQLYVAGGATLANRLEVGPGHVWLRLLAAQLEQRHSGPALLMLLEPLTQTPVSAMAPQTMANIITGLNFFGFTAEAHQLALAALLPPPVETKAEPDAAGTTAD